MKHLLKAEMPALLMYNVIAAVKGIGDNMLEARRLEERSSIMSVLAK